MTTRSSRLSNWTLVLVFVASIWAPLVVQALRKAPSTAAELRERRKLLPFPKLHWTLRSTSSFPQRFDGYYRDQFGLREPLVRLHNVIRWFGLGTSPSPAIIRGEDGWLFFAEDGILDQVRGARPFTREELDAWRDMLERRRDWLAERGIEYLFVLGPTKGEVYPEYLPPEYAKVGPSRMDQFVDHMARYSDVEVLNLEDALVAEKRHDQGQDFVYYPLGTHWTFRGAFVAYREIIARLRPTVWPDRPIPERSDFHKRLTKTQGDSWAGRLYMDDLLVQENWAMVHKGPAVTPRAIPNARIAEQYVQPDSDLPRVMLFHDSYAMLVKPMLALDCSRLVCIWQTTLDLARIEEEQPDVVIDMMVERMLGRPIPADSPLDSQEELQAAFEASDEILFDREALLSEGEIEAVGESVFRRVLHAPERGIGITPGTGFGLFNCPELRIPEGSDAVVALELTAPEDTSIEFLYPRGPVLDYPRAFAVRVFVHAGRSRVYARIRPRDFTIEGRLRVGSGTRAGDWILHRVEARAIPEVQGG